MKILITGGAGYIGSIVASLLIQQGHQIRVLDDLSTGHLDAVPNGADFFQGNVLDPDVVTQSLHKVDAVMHFAAKSLVGESVEKPELYWTNNVEGTKNLLDQMNKQNVKNIVFSSTAAVYGDPKENPITENSPTEPKNPYGESKLAVDRLLTQYCESFGFAAISLRYFNVAGAEAGLGERHDPETHLIPRALSALLKDDGSFQIFGDDWPTPDGTCIRDYIHVSDLADAHIKALKKLEPGKHLICNLGTESGSSVLEVIAAIEEVTGKKIVRKIGSRRAGDPAVLVASNLKAKSLLGWEPILSLERMVADAYEFMKAQQ